MNRVITTFRLGLGALAFLSFLSTGWAQDSGLAVPLASPSTEESQSTSFPASPDNASPPADSPSPASSSARWRSSLMYDINTLRRFHQALDRYRARHLNPDDGENPASLSTETTPVSAAAEISPDDMPEFYVSSVFYQGDDAWSVWINGEKYTPANPPQEVSILHVQPDYVTLLWKMGPFESFTDLLAEKLEETQQRPGPHAPITFDKGMGWVRFTLSPNQRLKVAEMRIIEGKPPAKKQPEGTLENPGGAAANFMAGSDNMDEDSDFLTPPSVAPVTPGGQQNDPVDSVNKLMHMYKNIPSMLNK